MVTVSGRAIVRRQSVAPPKGAFDLAAVASVEVTSEQSLFPIDNVFDGQSGSGGSCWVAETGGEQIITLAFHVPQDVRAILVESEVRGDSRTQRVEVAFTSDEAPSYVETPSQTFRFTPYGPSFHRGAWDVAARAVKRIRLRITPEPSHRRASLTSIVVR